MSAPTMDTDRHDDTMRVCTYTEQETTHRRCLVTNKLDFSFFFISRILSVPKKELQKSVQVFK